MLAQQLFWDGHLRRPARAGSRSPRRAGDTCPRSLPGSPRQRAARPTIAAAPTVFGQRVLRALVDRQRQSHDGWVHRVHVQVEDLAAVLLWIVEVAAQPRVVGFGVGLEDAARTGTAGSSPPTSAGQSASVSGKSAPLIFGRHLELGDLCNGASLIFLIKLLLVSAPEARGSPKQKVEIVTAPLCSTKVKCRGCCTAPLQELRSAPRYSPVKTFLRSSVPRLRDARLRNPFCCWPPWPEDSYSIEQPSIISAARTVLFGPR